MTKVQVIGQRINPEEERWVVYETAEKPNKQEHIPVKCPWKLQTKLPERMVENFQTVAMKADDFAYLLKRIIFKKYREIVFESVSHYPKDHQDPRSVLKISHLRYLRRSPEAKEKLHTDSQWTVRKYECTGTTEARVSGWWY